MSQHSGPIEEDLEDLFENAPCGYISLRLDGRVAKANRTFCVWMGYLSSSDLVGKKFHDLLSIAGRIYYETHFAPLLRMQGFFNEVALDLIRKDRQPLSVLVNATERRDADGRPLFIRLTVFNATDRRKYERALLLAKDELSALNESLQARVIESDGVLRSQSEEARLREQFIAILGHDLRNPLASISAGIRLMQKSKLDERGFLLMHQSVGRMASLIDNLLDFARGRLGSGITLNRSDQPLAPVLRQIIDELQSTHPDTQIITELDFVEPINSDPIRMGQVLSNLLSNALAYGADGRPVTVSAKLEDDFVLSVSNEGSAIPESAMSRLFNPFSRGEVRPSQQGLGLGLYIASEIAKAHGGSISVKSTPDQTRFAVRIPIK